MFNINKKKKKKKWNHLHIYLLIRFLCSSMTHVSDKAKLIQNDLW